MRFFSVQERRMIEVPDDRIKAVKYERTTRSGKKQVRYALKAEYNGRKLTKFVDEATYKRYAGQKASVAAEVTLQRKRGGTSELQKQASARRWGLGRQCEAQLPRGTPGAKLAALAGSITDADAEQMLRAIEESCEQIDGSQW